MLTRKTTARDGTELLHKVQAEFQPEKRIGKEVQAEGNCRYRGLAHTITAEVVVTLAGHSQDI